MRLFCAAPGTALPRAVCGRVLCNASMERGTNARRGRGGRNNSSGNPRPQRGGGRFNCDKRRGPGRGGQQQQPQRGQVCFPGVYPEDGVVAIVGGGLSGLTCALELAKLGVRSVVFDTGEHGVGGRLGTRSEQDGSLPGAPAGVPGLVFDHAAQYFTATDPQFLDMVQQWEADGVVRRWDGPVGELRNGAFTPLPSSQPRYVVRGGMRQLAEYLAAKAASALRQQLGNGSSSSSSAARINGMVEVRRPQWVSDLIPEEEEGAWRLMGRGRDQGLYSAVVIAHNGKCANRLAAPAGIPQVYNQLRRLKLSANWVLMVAFGGDLPLGQQQQQQFEGAFIKDSQVLSWAANNTRKLRLGGNSSGSGSGSGSGGVQCWTLISTQEYGAKNKVPQENVPQEVRERVTAEMLAEFARCLGLPDKAALPVVAYTRVQLWGAALPINSPGVPCIWDPQGRAGVCGDWVHSGGSMQAAALSGVALAQQIAGMRGKDAAQAAGLAMGLADRLEPVGGTAIGQFPAEPSEAKPKKAAAAAAAASKRPARVA